MASVFAAVLDSLIRQRGVTAAMVVSERDGIAVEANLQIGQSGDRVAALAAFLYRKARLSARAAGMGEVSFLQLEAPGGRICAVGGGALVLVAVAEATVNVGLIRVELLRGVDALRAVGGAERDG
jgi:predicted regulator of Ras-like GTPase activity (Roadblock/LC7/MglB family)